MARYIKMCKLNIWFVVENLQAHFHRPTSGWNFQTFMEWSSDRRTHTLRVRHSKETVPVRVSFFENSHTTNSSAKNIDMLRN